MDEKTKKEWQELQNELAELKNTLDEYQNWMDNEGAELEDMCAQLQFLKESEDDVVPEHPFRLPEDYPLPRAILQQHFPRTAKQCNFSGGWGYDVEHATIVKEFDPEINPDEKFDGVSLEYAFIDKRIREELIFNRPEGERFEELDYNTIGHSLHRIDGVPYDYILVEVTAYPEKEWLELKADWESHNGYKDDPDGRKRNLERKDACKITYRAEYYFNINNFMS
ncbi:MAG: hypothetical protein IKB16_03890 [Lentisphaeria bacterium]|nr:hypothetical protein [Lentisphaeria bacterium]